MHVAWRKGPGPVCLVLPMKLPPMSSQTPLSRRGACLFSQDNPGFPKAASKSPGPSPSWVEVSSVSTLRGGTCPGALGILSLNFPPAQMATASCPRPKRQAGIHLQGFPDPAHAPSQPAEHVTGSKHPDRSYSREAWAQFWSKSTRGRGQVSCRLPRPWVLLARFQWVMLTSPLHPH